jgi:hypothetical protein
VGAPKIQKTLKSGRNLKNPKKLETRKKSKKPERNSFTKPDGHPNPT